MAGQSATSERGWDHPSADPASEYESAVLSQARYFAGLIQSHAAGLRGAGGQGKLQLQALRTLEAETGNILEALDSAIHRSQTEWLTQYATYLGMGLQLSGEHSLLLELGTRLLEVAERVGPAGLKARALLMKSDAHRRRAEHAAALVAAQSAAAIGSAPEELRCQALIRQGIAQKALGQTEHAVSLLQEACSLAEQAGGQGLQAEALADLGELTLALGKHEEAQQQLAQATAMLQRQGHLYNLVTAVNNLAIAHIRLGNYSAGRERLEEALRLRQAMVDPRGEALTLVNLGVLQLDLGELDSAQTYFTRARGYLEQSVQRETYALLLCNLSLLHYLRQEWRPAERCAVKAVSIFQDSHNTPGLATALRQSAIVALAQSRNPIAKFRLLRALELAEAARATREIVLCCGLVGVLLYRSGAIDMGTQLVQSVLMRNASDKLNFEAHAIQILAEVPTAPGPDLVQHDRLLDQAKHGLQQLAF